MANPENLRPPWKPGESGNPQGYSRKRRASVALIRLIEEEGFDVALAKVWMRMALGDPKTGKEPDKWFFGQMLDRTEGPIKARGDDDDNGPPEPPKDEHGNPVED